MTQPKPCPLCGRDVPVSDGYAQVVCDCCIRVDEELITLRNYQERPTTPPTVETRIQVQVASQTLSLTQDEAQALWDALTPHVRHPDIASTPNERYS